MTLNKTLANIIFGALIAGLCIPFIVMNSTFFPFISGKGFVFRIGMEIVFMLWVVLAIRDRSYLPKFSWILASIAIFLGVMGLADFFAVNPSKAFWSNYERMEGYITLIHLFMYFLVAAAVVNTKKRWNIFMAASVGASLIMCFYGFLQLAGKIAINQGGVRLDGTLGNAIYLAVYMLFNMFFAAYLSANSTWSQTVRYVVFGPILIFQTIILYYTATRGVVLGLIAGALISAVLIIVLEKENKSLRRHAIATVVGVVVIVGGFLMVRHTDFVAQSPTLNRFASLSISDVQNQGRSFIWPIAIKGFLEHPILGWGQEGFNYPFNKYYIAPMYTQEAWFDRTHDIFLDWLIAGGALGLAAYLAILGVLFWSIWRSSYGVREKSLMTGLVAAYIFQNIFAFDNLTSYLFFFSVLACVHVDITRADGAIGWLDRWVKKIFHGEDVHNRNTLQGLAVAVCTIVLIVGVYWANLKPLFANQELILAINPGVSTAQQSIDHFKNIFDSNTFGTPEAREQLYVLQPQFQKNSSPEIDAAFEDFGKQQLVEQATETPLDSRYLLFLGTFLNRNRQFADAIPYLQRAVATSPQKQAIAFELGVSYINLHQYATALDIFKKAFESAPQYSDARIFYGIAAIYVGNDALAAEVLKPIDQKSLVMDDRILNAYAALSRWDQTIRMLKARIDVDPSNTQSYFSLAAAYLKTGDRTRAIQELEQAKSVDPRVAGQVDSIVSDLRAGKNF